MKEDLLFEIMNGMRDADIAEAAEWKYRKRPAPEQEISAILQGERHAAVSETEPEQDMHAETENVSVPEAVPEQPDGQRKLLRFASVSIGGIAAAIALTVGLVTMYAGRDRTETYSMQPGMPGITAENIPEAETKSVRETAAAQQDITTEHTTTAEPTTVPAIGGALPESQSVTLAGGENYFGGKGELRPLSSSGGNWFEDDAWYYSLTYSYGYPQYFTRFDKNNPDADGSFTEESLYDPYATEDSESAGIHDIVPRMISDGERLYEQPLDINGGLCLLDDAGQRTVFLSNARIRQETELQGGVPEYYRIEKLGDTGRYYLFAAVNAQQNSDDPALHMLLNMIYTPETDTLIILPDEKKFVGNTMHYDAEHDYLYLGTNRLAYRQDNIAVQVQPPTVYMLNAETGDVLAYCVTSQYVVFDAATKWAVCGDTLYYLTRKTRNEGNGVQVMDMNVLCRYSFETGENMEMDEFDGVKRVCALGGKLYLLEHNSVSDDRIVAYDPETAEKQVIKECREINELLCSDGQDGYLYATFGSPMRRALYSSEKGWLLFD